MSVMAQHAASPPLADSRAGTVYLVLDDFGGLGWCTGTDAAQADPKPVVADLSSGQYRHPLRVGGAQHHRGLGARCQRRHRARGSHSCVRVGARIASRGARFRGAGECMRARPSPRQCAVVRRHPRRQLRRLNASKTPPVHTPVAAMSRRSCIMGISVA
jgi:hypothetical protein